MEKLFHRPFLLFTITTVLLAAVFFIFPIEIFDGEIVIERGLQNMTVPRQLSLSNLLGFGTEWMEGEGIVDYYLTTKGIIIAFIIIIGMPGLFAYRMYLKATTSKEK